MHKIQYKYVLKIDARDVGFSPDTNHSDMIGGTCKAAEPTILRPNKDIIIYITNEFISSEKYFHAN